MSKLCVLVVEDEPLIQMDVVDQLEDEGFKVFAAFDAAEAIRLLTANPEIRVVFTDIDMPGSMDGIALAHYVRDRWPPIKIIVTSGHRTVQRGQLPNGSPFFQKPYNSSKLISKMKDMVASE